MNRPINLGEEQNYLYQFQQLVKRWDEGKNDPNHFDPTEVLTEMANILEKVLENQCQIKALL